MTAPISQLIYWADGALQSVVDTLEQTGWQDFTDADEIALEAMKATLGQLLVMRAKHKREAA